MIWNPQPHIRHAWADTKTVWGKISLILFYTLVWYFIISAAWSIVFPHECFMSAIGGYDDPIAVATVRAAYVFSLGFFCYADVGGYKIKNIAMVTVFMLADLMIWSSVADDFAKIGCKDDISGLYFFCAWAVLALILAVIDDKLGGRPSDEESLPLNS